MKRTTHGDGEESPDGEQPLPVAQSDDVSPQAAVAPSKVRTFPSGRETTAALMTPRQSFIDPELADAVVRRMANDPRKPWADSSGSYAIVYHLTRINWNVTGLFKEVLWPLFRSYDPSVHWKEIAFRCWRKDIGDAAKIYKAISDELKEHKLPIFIGFEYIVKAIRINGSEYEGIKMDWVEGQTIKAFVDRHVDDTATLRILATEFRKLVGILHQHGLAHGDLQGGNLMVVETVDGWQLRLIDYDTLIVPALYGEVAPISGDPCYQHPLRFRSTGAKRSKHDDYFSELVIYCSLVALASDKEVRSWYRNELRQQRIDGLLFRRADFENPGKSGIFSLLSSSPDAQVRHLSAALAQYCDRIDWQSLDPLEAVDIVSPTATVNARPSPVRVGAKPQGAPKPVPHGRGWPGTLVMLMVLHAVFLFLHFLFRVADRSAASPLEIANVVGAVVGAVHSIRIHSKQCLTDPWWFGYNTSTAAPVLVYCVVAGLLFCVRFLPILALLQTFLALRITAAYLSRAPRYLLVLGWPSKESGANNNASPGTGKPRSIS